MTTTTSFRGSVKEVKQVPTSLALHVLFSLLIHLAQLTLSALLAFALYHDVTHRDVFFALTSGLTILPLVTLQLLSAIFLLRSHGDSMSGREAVVRAGTHVLQLGFLWRHLDLLQPKDLAVRRRDLKELQLLRMVFALIGGFPLLLLQLYLTLAGMELGWTWLLPVSVSVSMVSCAWTLANLRSSRHQHQHQQQRQQQQQPGKGVSWVEFVICALWRAGEVASRMISLALFACLFQHWVLGVLAMHWVVMVIYLNLPHSQSHTPSSAASSTAGKVLSRLLTSYSSLWCFVTVCDVRTAVWCVVYYVIAFLENVTLCVVWVILAEAEGFVSRYLPVLLSGLAFLMAMLCLALHHRHFRLETRPAQAYRRWLTNLVLGMGRITASAGKAGREEDSVIPRSSGLSHTNPRQNLLYFADSMARGAININETDAEEGRASWLTDAEGCNPWLTDAEGRGAWLTDAEGRGAWLTEGRSSWLTNAEGPSSWLTNAEGRGSWLTNAEGCGAWLTDAEGRGSWLTNAKGRGSWLDSASDRLSVNTTSTGRPFLPTALERGCGDSGCEVVSGCGRYRSPCSSSSGVVPGRVDTGHHHRPAPPFPSLYPFTSVTSAKSPGYLQKPDRDNRPQSDGYSTDHTILEWSKLPVTPLADNVWHIHDTDTTDCCYSYLSPGDSETSCTIPASHSSRLGSCSRACCHCAGGDAVYGIPRQLIHLPRREDTPQKTSLPDLQKACPCCLHHQRKKGVKNPGNPSSVFTVCSHSRHCSSYGDYVNMSTPYSASSTPNIYRVVKKSKLDRRKQRRQQYPIPSTVLSSRHDRRLSMSSSILSSTEAGSVSTVSPRNRAKKERDMSIPSRLQVRAILPKSDEDIPVKARTSSAPGPVYENVSMLKQDNLHSRSEMLENPLTVKKRQENRCIKSQENPRSVKKTGDRMGIKNLLENPHCTSISQTTSATTINTSKKINTDQIYVNSHVHPHHDDPFDRKSCSRQQRRLKKPATDLKENRTSQIMGQLHYLVNINDTFHPLQETGVEKDRGRSSRSGGYPRQWVCAGTQGKGCVCSESEDSALPTETFSSSVEDGCQGTDVDSEDNMELII